MRDDSIALDGKFHRGRRLTHVVREGVLDTDHYTQGTHVPAFKTALKEAMEAGIRTAVSNPCFELWLLLHVREVKEQFANAKEVAAALHAELVGAYDKTNVPAARLLVGLELAITRARTLDVGVEGGWPQKTGTQVHLLAAELTARP